MHRERLRIDEELAPLSAHFVTENFFAELGAGARLGRLLAPGVDGATTEPVAVLSHHFWERRFGVDPTVVGKTMVLNGRPVTIAGVAVRGFGGLTFDDPDVWLPIAQPSDLHSGQHAARRLLARRRGRESVGPEARRSRRGSGGGGAPNAGRDAARAASERHLGATSG